MCQSHLVCCDVLPPLYGIGRSRKAAWTQDRKVRLGSGAVPSWMWQGLDRLAEPAGLPQPKLGHLQASDS